ncbi:MAG TPA: L-seryl-tRNA(Sec) selenium transferase [Deltaproteobacteria bacterium]|nr:L-seryl-tRNA(Sec) selenium transferase [Deltaproteobacteria bacterium]
MENQNKAQDQLRRLPGVDHIIDLSNNDPFFSEIPRKIIVQSIRSVIEKLRSAILADPDSIFEDNLTDTEILKQVKKVAEAEMTPNLKRTINATGIVVHTNLGRSLLAQEAMDHVLTIAGGYSNLEFDLEAGHRGSRYSAVEDIICELCGCEAAMVVNNNAGAVLLCLETVAKGKKVIVSRGELVEIGGSFRIPDVMAKSGSILHEVGTTNRTHLRDYEGAIETDTALLLKVHRSNYQVVGFTAEVALKELVTLGATYQIPVMEDLGSGTLIDFSAYGLFKEPTVQESIKAGADIVTFSGDKLLGGPQAGIIAGKKEIVDAVKKNPLTRALRIDKLTLAALESTLRLYWDEDQAVSQIPTLRMLTLPFDIIEKRAESLLHRLEKIEDRRMEAQLADCTSRSGGGALPLLDLPSKGLTIAIKGMSPNSIEAAMRNYTTPIIGRIEDDKFILDVRTVRDDELHTIQNAFEKLLRGPDNDDESDPGITQP